MHQTYRPIIDFAYCRLKAECFLDTYAVVTDAPRWKTRCSAIAETALQGALRLKVEDWNCKTVFYGYYTSIFNHCDIIGLQGCRIL